MILVTGSSGVLWELQFRKSFLLKYLSVNLILYLLNV